MKKRIVSLLLALILICNLIVFESVPAVAANLTANTAVSWLRSLENKYIDVDGNGQWCTDLATAYINYLWLTVNGDSRSPFGLYPYTTKNGNQYDNYLTGNPNWTIITRTASTIPQPGDLFVSEQDDFGNGYGHVGVILEVNGAVGATTIEMSGNKSPFIHYVNWGSSPSYGAQHFIRFNYFSSPYANLGDDFYAFIISSQDWLHLTAEKNNVQIADQNNSNDPKQIWHFIRTADDNRYKIINEYNGYCLDDANFGTGNGTNIGLSASNDSTAQRWYITTEGELSPQCATGSCMDVTNGSFTAGQNIQLYQRNGSSAQHFTVYKLSQDGAAYAVPKPAAPQNVAASVSGRAVTISWNASKSANQYDYARTYEIYLFNAVGETLKFISGIKETNYTIKNLEPGTYACQVVACASNYDTGLVPAYTKSGKLSFTVAPCAHRYVPTVTAPTCTKEGYTTYTCELCGSSYVGEQVKALGHDYVDGACLRCDAKEPNYTGPCPSLSFTDVPARENWAHKGIDYCIARGYMNGLSDTIFAPQGTVTRGQLVTILYRAAGSPAIHKIAAFRDVANGQWYAEAVSWAAEQGIVTGYTDNTFRPMGKITREQIATILYRYSGEPEPKGSIDSFPDRASVSSYAAKAMAWAVGEGLITGIASHGTTTLAPKSTATRAQIAAIIMRYLTKGNL